MNASPASSSTSRTRQAVLALFVVTLIWGGTFVWMKEALEVSALHLGPGASTAAIALFTFLRFGSAAALVFLAVPAARRGLTREAWRGPRNAVSRSAGDPARAAAPNVHSRRGLRRCPSRGGRRRR